MRIIKFIFLAALSLLILLLGMPNVEQGRLEFRNQYAFHLAPQIKTGELPPDTVDPWDHAFEIEHTPSDEMVVTSRGANGTSPADGFDADDISTSMSNPPHKKTMTRKQRQFFATLALSLCPWLIAWIFRVRSKRMGPQIG
ncbi:hypothetical protein [Gimesia maris]|uniref:hypothetical protein n=1 Tax=Gimesia maris TaxID=122 RepID=UPI0032EAE443